MGVAEKEEASDICRPNKEDLALLVTAIKKEPTSIMVAWQVVLKAMRKTSVIISARVAGVMRVSLYDSSLRNHALIKRKAFIDVYTERLFKMPLPSLT